jgi:hypothetical protein
MYLFQFGKRANHLPCCGGCLDGSIVPVPVLNSPPLIVQALMGPSASMVLSSGLANAKIGKAARINWNASILIVFGVFDI